MRSDRERLLDIREAISKIDQHTWAVIEKDLPALKNAVEAILQRPEG
jgi:uncharacterized protein with HEPN domain